MPEGYTTNRVIQRLGIEPIGLERSEAIRLQIGRYDTAFHFDPRQIGRTPVSKMAVVSSLNSFSNSFDVLLDLTNLRMHVTD